jgi:methyl-accepting chemotaxis protein
MRLSNMKVGARLGGGFAVLLSLAIAASALGIYTLSASHKDTERLVQGDVARLAAALRLDSAARANGRHLPEMLLSRDPAATEKMLQHVAENAKKTAQAVDELEKLVDHEAGKKALASISEAASRFTVSYRKLLVLVKRGQHDDAVAAFQTQVSPALDLYTAAIADLVKIEENAMQEALVGSDARFVSARGMLVALAAVMVLLGVLISWWVARSITKPLARAVDVAQRVAAGDLTTSVDATGRDETAQLLRALADMNGALKGIVGEVRSGTHSIVAASEELAAGNSDLSQRTEQQAASLEETASSMEELTSTVRQNAGSAKQANMLAAEAAKVAEAGGEVVAEVVRTMSAINDSSKKIADIIGVIDSIAFQTNILALNAAVEAARAGEQGRGFAVVAAEVRSLAQRSAGAAKEIKQLISESVDKVANGTRLVDRAGTTMGEVVASVHRVTGIIGEISNASAEQTLGIEHINRAITQMDAATQQNAALVEEAAAAAESMREQAQSLGDKVSVFRIDDTAPRAPAATLAQPSPHDETEALLAA